MNKKKTIVSLISTVFLVAAIVLTNFVLQQREYRKMVNEDIRIEKFELYQKGPSINDFKLAKSKGYSTSNKQVTSEYLDLQSKYNEALAVFLNEKLSLSGLDSQLDALGILKVPKTSIAEINSTESYYRNNSHLNSDYIYLRNNINIEFLDQPDAKLLETLDINKSSDKEKLMEMISRTFIKILRVNLPDFDDNGKIAYSITHHNEGVSKSTIVFWFNNPTEFDNEGNIANPEKYKANLTASTNLAEEYSLIFSEELNCEVKIFMHPL